MKDAVVVLGMHRSGTSAVAGVVGLLGAALPNTLMSPDRNNERGYFEAYNFMNLNDRILKSVGSDWMDWRPLREAWFATPTALGWRSEIAKAVQDEYAGVPFIVVKDPRVCRMATLWADAIDDAGYRPKYLLIFRNPLEVAASMSKRDNIFADRGLLIWLRYVLDAELRSRKAPRSIVCMNDLLSNWRVTMEKVGQELDLVWPRQSDLAAHEIDDFLSSELRHHSIDVEQLSGREGLREWAMAAFGALQTLSIEPLSNSALIQLDNLRAEFDRYGVIFGPVMLEAELRLRQAELEIDQVRNLTNDIAQLKIELQTKADEVRNLSLNLVQSASDHERSLADHEAQQLELQARADAAANLKAEIDGTRAELANREHELAEVRHEVADEQRRAAELATRIDEREQALVDALAAVGAEAEASQKLTLELENEIKSKEDKFSEAIGDAAAARQRLMAIEADLAEARVALVNRETMMEAQIASAMAETQSERDRSSHLEAALAETQERIESANPPSSANRRSEFSFHPGKIYRRLSGILFK